MNNGEIGLLDKYDFVGEYITWTTHGIYAGSVFYRTGKFSITNNCGIFQTKNTTLHNLKYVYYYLLNVLKKYVNPGSTIPILIIGEVKKIKIPFPPLPIQEKIVADLDRFEQYLNPINGLLHQEIRLREQQYLYYRDWLLNFK